ncbi:MAG: CheR family methyltransferase [Clostridia bacterium]|jgi:chemotaxis protein methyltransferase CheR
MITDEEFRSLTSYIKKEYGIDLNRKKSLVAGRLQPWLREKNFSSVSEYMRHAMADSSGEALSDLLNRLTTRHTYFMREADHFFYLNKTVLPYLISKERTGKDLRFWSAGCASGEEAYTLAMLLLDASLLMGRDWDTRVLATDISSHALEKARTGIYSNEAIRPLPPAWQKRYFRKIDDQNSQILDFVRREVIFRRFNLMNKVFPFKRKFHVIFCRNVMIYFDNQTKQDLVERFYHWTEPGGYLFVGLSESLSRQDTPYKFIKPGIYRKEPLHENSDERIG